MCLLFHLSGHASCVDKKGDWLLCSVVVFFFLISSSHSPRVDVVSAPMGRVSRMLGWPQQLGISSRVSVKEGTRWTVAGLVILVLVDCSQFWSWIVLRSRCWIALCFSAPAAGLCRTPLTYIADWIYAQCWYCIQEWNTSEDETTNYKQFTLYFTTKCMKKIKQVFWKHTSTSHLNCQALFAESSCSSCKIWVSSQPSDVMTATSLQTGLFLRFHRQQTHCKKQGLRRRRKQGLPEILRLVWNWIEK